MPGGPKAPLSIEETGQTYLARSAETLSSIFSALVTGRYDSIVLPSPLILWALDLKYWFPGIRVVFNVESASDESLSLQIEHLIDGVVREPRGG